MFVESISLHKRGNRTSQEAFSLPILLGFVLGTLALGGLGALIGNTGSYQDIIKPPLAPPAWLFPVAWSILYVLMGIAAYLVWQANAVERSDALRLYLAQLIVNVLWPLFFFRLEWRLFAFFWLLLLVALVSLTMVGFRALSKPAYALLVPYMAWLIFAGYLNLATYFLNL